ncbi:hydroxyisourate hydrolase [Enterovibrio baiacu]|uniref:hydroxyisourate hydrolase n=1 Tax=Enterovibrio baiacu TaxID=2491023 RepID=UPI003D110E72
MGRLTTHVLDTANGTPGAEIEITLFRHTSAGLIPITRSLTNQDGRTDSPLLEDSNMEPGKYQLQFNTAQYFIRQGIQLDDIPFLDDVVIRFGINDRDAHYHVPLLVSPYSFSTYRGS